MMTEEFWPVPQIKRPKRNGGFVSLQEELGKYIELQQQSEINTALGLQRAWQAVAQETALAHTDNVVYSKRAKQTELLIYVDDASWATELSMNKEIYRLLMEKQLNKPVSDIKFLVSRTTAFRKKYRK